MGAKDVGAAVEGVNVVGAKDVGMAEVGALVVGAVVVLPFVADAIADADEVSTSEGVDAAMVVVAVAPKQKRIVCAIAHGKVFETTRKVNVGEIRSALVLH